MSGKTPLNDYSGLRIALTNKGELDAAEFDNISEATKKYLGAIPSKSRAPFTYEWFLKLHKEMLAQVWAWAGQIRKTNKNIGIDKRKVPEAIKLLEQDYHAWLSAVMDNDELSARLHHRLVWIHPFENGNGRWARLIVNVHQRQHGLPLIRWPNQAILDQTNVRHDYLQALQNADSGDFAPLIALQKRLQE